MNLRVTHGASLILRRLIVHRTDWPAGRQRGREGMALQAEHVHRHHLEQLRVGGAVRCVATAATLSLHRHVLIDVGSLLIDVALVANGVAAGQAAQLAHGRCAMRIVAVCTLDQALIDAVVIRLGKICLGGCVASVTQLRLILNEQVLFFLGVMRRVAIETSDFTAGMRGLREM